MQKEITSVLLTNFATRHFNKTFSGTKILSYTPEQFIDKVNYYLLNKQGFVQNGDFEFSRLITFDNFTGAKAATYPITLETAPYLKTDYFSRTDEELPVLSRWFEFPSWFIQKPAQYITLVLYSKEQIDKEQVEAFDADWGIVAILAHDNSLIKFTK